MAEASAKRVTGDEPQGTMGRVETTGLGNQRFMYTLLLCAICTCSLSKICILSVFACKRTVVFSTREVSLTDSLIREKATGSSARLLHVLWIFYCAVETKCDRQLSTSVQQWTPSLARVRDIRICSSQWPTVLINNSYLQEFSKKKWNVPA